MVRKTRPSAARAKVIRARQQPMKWGSAYVPGQLATREEAPDESRPGTMWSSEFGRAIHLMSNPERVACLVGMFLGALELHESSMLPPEPAPGPMAGCPFQSLPGLKSHQGTIQVAESLGVLKWHPVVPIEGVDGEASVIAFPLLADLIWYFPGPTINCVNWTVKATQSDFERPFRGGHLPRRPRTTDIDKMRARAAIEEELLRQVGVPTYRVTEEEIPRHVSLNLKVVYKYLSKEANLEQQLVDDVIDTLRYRIQMGVPIRDTLYEFMDKYGGTWFDYQIIFNKAIWHRKLRVDLWVPINIDQPIHPEQTNPSDYFAHWLKGGCQ